MLDPLREPDRPWPSLQSPAPPWSAEANVDHLLDLLNERGTADFRQRAARADIAGKQLTQNAPRLRPGGYIYVYVRAFPFFGATCGELLYIALQLSHALVNFLDQLERRRAMQRRRRGRCLALRRAMLDRFQISGSSK